ncbi:hypothetical protein KOL96_13720 [Ralstonia wenshanensis]|uniref:hypothetical protein n=1 Tax=Ralstonia wenshanensis TaxID=2842456 RepID=UPI001E4F785C|nr:hypothetical protein [Ralstonia wenshanensis]UGS92128.1 hypothetical protein KOL96_13720 [Ralstonia wenshanensis]
MSATESPKESTLNPPAGTTDLSKLRALIADDGFAATFQTMGRYRTALLQVASALARSPTPNVEAVVTDHSVEVDKMVAKQTKPKPPAFKYRDGEIRGADGRQLMLLMASNCTKKFRDRAGRTLVGVLNGQELQAPSRTRLPMAALEIHPTSAHDANADDDDSRCPPAQRLTIEL